jgi:hypothetical protein
MPSLAYTLDQLSSSPDPVDGVNYINQKLEPLLLKIAQTGQRKVILNGKFEDVSRGIANVPVENNFAIQTEMETWANNNGFQLPTIEPNGDYVLVW